MIFMSTQISLLTEIKIKKKEKEKKKLNEGLTLGSKSRLQSASHFGGEKMVNVENIFSRYVNCSARQAHESRLEKCGT